MSGEQLQSSVQSDVKNEEKNDITEQILKRIKNIKFNVYSNDMHHYFPLLIVAFVSMISFLMNYQINTTSSYIGSGLRVPSHNVGIFVAKLTSYRSFLMMVGFGFAYLIYYICTLFTNENEAISLTLKVISLFFLYFLMASRGCLLFSSFLTKNLSYNVYFFLSIDALAAGSFQMSLILLVPQFIFITFLSIHLLALFFFLTQFVFDLFLSNKPLVMIRIQFSMCLIVSYIGFGLWALYLFKYHDFEPKYYKEELYKQNESMKKVNYIYKKLEEQLNKAMEIIKTLDDKTNDWMSFYDPTTKKLSNIRSIILEILSTIKDFDNLLKEVLQFIEESINKVEKLYKQNESDSGTEKSNKNFSTSKTKHVDTEFSIKLEGLNKIFTKSNNKDDLSNLIGRLSHIPQKLNDIFNDFNGLIVSGDKKDIYEEIRFLKSQYDNVFVDSSRITLNFHDNSKNTITINDLELKWKPIESDINNKIKKLLQITKKTLDDFGDEINKHKSDLGKITSIQDKIMEILSKNSDHIIFCYIMIALASFFRDFLYPPIIPHALLTENESQKILFLGIILQLLFCFPVFILDEILNIFTLFMEEYFIYFWTLVGPPLIVLILTLLAIHTKISFFHSITGSTGRVFTLSLFLIPFCTLMESVSYAYLSHYVFNQLGFSYKNLSFLLFHQLLEMFCTYFFSKLSAGYNHARVRLGHCLPTYTTNYEMTFCQEFWSMLKWILQYTFKDILFFFSTNIRQYL